MRSQKSEVRSQKRRRILFVSFLLFTIHFSLFTAVVFASEKWRGIDESVVEKVAKEHGREAMKPLINTDQGDLLLFVFLLAGTIGGFIAGYSWKKLIERKTPEQGGCDETGLSKAVKREGKR